MPITPFHFGPGLLLKSFGGKGLSWLTFALGNLLLDIEPVAWFLLTGEPVHRHAHTYLGALLIGILAATAGRPLCEHWQGFWNRQLSPGQRRWLGVNEGIPVGAAWLGALLGTFSHVVLDSVMHADITPWWPLEHPNGLLQLVSIDALQVGCVAAGIWGALRMVASRARVRVRPWLGRVFSLIDLGSIVVVMLLSILLGMGHLASLPEQPRDFDAALWRKTSAQTDRGNPRAAMSRAAQAWLVRHRPTRSDTLALLGPADAGQSSPVRWSYYLGFASKLAMDPSALIVEFDAEGRFLAVSLATLSSKASSCCGRFGEPLLELGGR